MGHFGGKHTYHEAVEFQ